MFSRFPGTFSRLGKPVTHTGNKFYEVELINCAIDAIEKRLYNKSFVAEHGEGVTRLATWLLKFCRLEAEVSKVESPAVRAGQRYLWHVQCREYGLWDFFFDRNGLLKPLEKLLQADVSRPLV